MGARRITDVCPPVCPEFVSSHYEIAPFGASFVEGGGLKNRCRECKKIAIAQLLVYRILTVCGEVAERLKAAVC